MNVLSLFDGMSCGRIALDACGISVSNYFASEVDRYAISVSKHNYPDIIHVGDVCKVHYNNGILTTEYGTYNIGKIDLLLGGSPCQGFSSAGKQEAFSDSRSALYFQYERILGEVIDYNPNANFLLENVKMKQCYEDIITNRLGVSPLAINSNLVSAQNRIRVYWSNIKGVELPSDTGVYLRDIVQDVVDSKYYAKSGSLKWVQAFGQVGEEDGYLTVSLNSGCGSSMPTLILQWPHGSNKGGLRALDGKTPTLTTSSWEANNLLLHRGRVRKLTPEECEELQTIPAGYTYVVSNSQRYKMLGNGWTINVISQFLNKL